jgi:hypothetical protein
VSSDQAATFRGKGTGKGSHTSLVEEMFKVPMATTPKYDMLRVLQRFGQFSRDDLETMDAGQLAELIVFCDIQEALETRRNARV